MSDSDRLVKLKAEGDGEHLVRLFHATESFELYEQACANYSDLALSICTLVFDVIEEVLDIERRGL